MGLSDVINLIIFFSAFICAGFCAVIYYRILSYLEKYDPDKWYELRPDSGGLGRLIDYRSYSLFLKEDYKPKTKSHEIHQLRIKAKRLGKITSILVVIFFIWMVYDVVISIAR